MATLSELQQRLEKLNAAMDSGVLSMEIGGRKIVYRSIDEMERAKNHLTAEIAKFTAPRRGSFWKTTFSGSRGE
jgi:hypothetical protein